MRNFLQTVTAASLAVVLAMPASYALHPTKSIRGNETATAVSPGFATKAQNRPKMEMPKAKRVRIPGGFAQISGASLPMANPYRVHALAAGGTTELYGSVIYSNDWTAGSEAGIYSINLSGTPTLTPIMVDNSLGSTGGGTMANGNYLSGYILEFFGMAFYSTYIFDSNNEWAKIYNNSDASTSDMALDMTYDASDNTVYGCFYNEEGTATRLATVNQNDYTITEIAPMSVPVTAIAADGKGSLFAVDYYGQLVTIDKATAAMTVIGNTGLTNSYARSGCIDPKTGVFYVTHSPVASSDSDVESGYLYTVDTATGEATLLFELPGGAEITGLYIPAAPCDDAAPAAVSDLKLNFPEGALTGTVDFTAPATLYDGSDPATVEALTYTVMVNGEAVATGECNYGAAVSAPVTLSEAGLYKVEVYVTNNVGDGPKTKVSEWIGNDLPSAVKDVNLAYADGTLTLTWSPVENSLNGGYFDPEAVTYDVVRLTDGETVAADLATTTFSEYVGTPENLVRYSYSVQAKFNGAAGAAGTSNSVVLGTAEPPYECAFTSEDDLAMFTIIDANNDYRQWMYDGDRQAVKVAYNSSLAMDDWLITPPLKLKAGTEYEVTVAPFAYSAYFTERIEVMFGSDASAEAMTTTVIPSTDVTWAEPQDLTGTIVPAEDGVYYVGVHGISEPDRYYILVDKITISAGKETTLPGSATNLKVARSSADKLTAEISFDAPATDIAGNALSSLDKVEVLCGEDVIATFSNPAPGAALSATYTATEAGFYTFTVVGYNAGGAGHAASDEIYLGVAAPQVPTEAFLMEVEEGTVYMAWTPTTEDIYGNPLDESEVTYIVGAPSGGSTVQVLASGLTEPEFIYQVQEEGQEQQFVYFFVFAETAGGSSPGGKATPMIPVGKPYESPYVESFANASLSSIIGTRALTEDASWSLCNDESFSGVVVASDGDNGFAVMQGSYYEDEALLFTGKIKVCENNPILSIDVFGLDLNKQNEVNIYVTCNNETNLLGTCNALADYQWVNNIFPLTQYAGQIITVTIDGVVKNYSQTLIDNLRVEQQAANDLALTALSVPASAMVNSEVTIEATVANYGVNAMSNFTVELYRDGNLVATSEPQPELASGSTTTVSFTEAFNANQAGEYTYYAKLVAPNDENDKNNTSAQYTIKVKQSTLKSVTLTGEYDSERGNVLSWEAPVLDNACENRLEDFENEAYTPFTTTDFGAWTLLNFNTSNTWGIQDVDFPGQTTGFGFILFNSDEVNAPDYAGHNSSATSLFAIAHRQGANDAYAISPLLSGNAQTVTFYAMALNTSYGPETFEVMYSTTDKDVASFQRVEVKDENGNVADVETVGATQDWVKYTVELPQGAKYFAIHSTATDVFALVIDDVEFEGYGPDYGTDVLGYNIYRDGSKLNDAPVTDTTFADADVADTHTYAVTVVYNRGESSLSNALTLEGSGIISPIASKKVRVAVEAGKITVTDSAAGRVSVAAANGAELYRGAGRAVTTVAVAPGIYMVTTSEGTVKVVVK